MLIDYHIHTKRCGHAEGEMEEYIAAAIEKGIREVGFADHFPMYFLPPAQRDPGIAMSEDELDDYVSEVLELSKKYAGQPGIEIKLGIEADYVPGFENRLKAMLDAYPFDYILGSVHFIDGWGFDNPAYLDEYKHRDIAEVYWRYFQLVRQAAASGLFDIMAHPDLVKKFGFRPVRESSSLNGFNLQEEYLKTAKTFQDAGVCVEVNTAGLRAPVREIYPSPEFLRMCRDYGIPVTLGSDAHSPGQVGEGFDKAVDLIKKAGCRKVAVFKGRKRSALSVKDKEWNPNLCI